MNEVVKLRKRLKDRLLAATLGTGSGRVSCDKRNERN